MDIAFLCGGEGARLRPLTYVVPKPMLPIGSKPILEINISRACEQGFKRVFLLVNYKAEVIQSYFGDGKSMGAEIQYFFEKERRGTAGPLGSLREVVDEPFIVMNADILTEIRLKTLIEFHRTKDAVLTVALKSFEIPIPYGVISIDDDDVIHEVQEKPQLDLLINSGIYALSPEILDIIPPDGMYPMIQLIADARHQEKRVLGFKFDDYWRDIGRMDDYLQVVQGNQDSDSPDWLKDLI